MKKILILTENKGKKRKKLVGYLEQSLRRKADVILDNLQNVSIYVSGKCVEIKVSDCDIRDYSLVYFRGLGDHRSEAFSFACSLAICLKHLKIKFFDSVLARMGCVDEKLVSELLLSFNGLPVPAAYFCWRDKIENNKKEICQKLGLPLVAKDLVSHRGENVFLIKDENDFSKLEQVPKNVQFLFQKYYPCDEEYRLLILNGRVAVWERKNKISDHEFRRNVALGAAEEFLDVKKVPRKMTRIAVKGAKILGLEISGADIMIDKFGKMWLLEENRGPGLTYDTEISPELPVMADFFGKEVGVRK